MALTKAKLIELIDNGDIDVGGDLLAIYPIGAIYQSTVSTSPATLFGGTWSAIGGRFLIGADGVYAAGSTGGEATHTLTIGEMAAHSHIAANSNGGGPIAFAPYTIMSGYTGASETYGYGIETKPVGSNGAHNNMPPYLSVYIWKRTA